MSLAAERIEVLPIAADVAICVARVPAVQARRRPQRRSSIAIHFSASGPPFRQDRVIWPIALPSGPCSLANRPRTSRWTNSCHKSPLCDIADLPRQEQSWSPRRVAYSRGMAQTRTTPSRTVPLPFWTRGPTVRDPPRRWPTIRGREGRASNAVLEFRDHTEIMRSLPHRHHLPIATKMRPTSTRKST
jgi:hypothetical protein